MFQKAACWMTILLQKNTSDTLLELPDSLDPTILLVTFNEIVNEC